jgi:hypothetical protein
MKIRHIPKSEALGYCHGCHNRAVVELTFSSLRPSLRLCERCDARHLIKNLSAQLNNGNGCENKPKYTPLGG